MKAMLDDTTITLKFEESLVSTTVKRLRQQYLDTMTQSPQSGSLTIDIAQVDMIDSQGLNLLIGIYKEMQQQGRQMRIVGVSRANRKLFELVNLQDFIPVIE